MIVDRATDQLMREWNEDLQQNNRQPLMLFSISQDGNISLTHTNEVTNAHIIDMCERIATIYRAK